MFFNFHVGKDSREYSGQAEKKYGSLEMSTQSSRSRHKFPGSNYSISEDDDQQQTGWPQLSSNNGCTIRGPERPVRDRL